jgi:CBS domain-containing protein
MILVRHILEDARRRLAVLSREASVCDAAAILANANTPLIVVCDSEGIAVGVVSRTDVVKLFSRARGDAFNTNAEAIMTKPVCSCHVDQTLQSVWATMSEVTRDGLGSARPPSGRARLQRRFTRRNL